MKKKLLAMGLAVCTVLSLSACGKDKAEETTAAVDLKFGEGTVTLGEYKGLTVYSDDIDVSEDDLEKHLNYRLSLDSTTEYKKEGTIKADDKVKVSYKGTVDGKEFTGGTSEGTVVSITDKGFSVDGFTDALIGHNVGDVVSMDLTLPDDFSDSTVKGKAVHYEVTIQSLVITIVPDLTDTYVKEGYGVLGLEKVSDFMEYLRNDLYINNIYSKIWSTVVENATVVDYNEDKYKEYLTTVSENQENSIYNSYGYTLTEYLSLVGQTQADWDKSISEYVQNTLKEEMIINQIANEENIEVSDEEYNKKMFEYAKLYGYSSAEEFIKAYDSIDEEDFKFSVTAYKVQEFVSKSAKVVQGSDPNAETTTTPETTTNSETTTSAE